MDYIVAEETFDTLNSYWVDSRSNLNWGLIFVLPGWLQVWWQVFGSGAELYLRSVRQEREIIGIAPLMAKGKTASFIGSIDVCDYLDFIIVPGKEADFFTVILDDLKRNGINQLELRSLRQDSTVLTYLIEIATRRGYDVHYQLEDASLALELPPSWEEYLASLDTKQRHELRRKLRNLQAAGNPDYNVVEDGTGIQDAMDTFLKLFSESRKDKAVFMTSQMELFFKLLANTMAKAGLLKFGVLKLDGLPTAMVMCFDYHECVYLYNSGYDPAYRALSAGLLAKVLCIKDSIQRVRKRFDFLKGKETYKYHLGGKEIPLYSCNIAIK